MDKKDFYLEVAYALSGCQLLEEELKKYIADAFALVRKFVGDRMTFKFDGDRYVNSSLEKLIDVFNKLSDNQPLIAELNKFKDDRNFLSHRGITHHLCVESGWLYAAPDCRCEQRGIAPHISPMGSRFSQRACVGS